MSATIQSMIEAFQTPQTRHAMLVHMPVALSALAVLVAIAAGIWGRAHAALRWSAVVAFLLLAVTAWFAKESGEDADHAIESGRLAEAAYETVEEHEHAAEKVVPVALALTVVAGVGAIAGRMEKKRVTLAAAWLAAAGGAGLAGWVAYVGHLGGSLVYGHGVGTPFPVAAGGGPLAPPATGEPPLPGDDGDGGPTDPRLVVARQAHAILDANCMRCHNPKRAHRAGGFDQTTIAGLLAGGHQGPAVVPGDPEGSLLLQAARHEIEDLEMPPEGDMLPPEDLQVLEQWIRDGAIWE